MVLLHSWQYPPGKRTIRRRKRRIEVAAGAIARASGGTCRGQKLWTAYGYGSTIPASLQPKEQANFDKLNASASSTFDKDFAAIMVASHKDAIDFLLRLRAEKVYVTASSEFSLQVMSSPKDHLAAASSLQTLVNQ